MTLAFFNSAAMRRVEYPECSSKEVLAGGVIVA
jgi:hypothetical protein